MNTGTLESGIGEQKGVWASNRFLIFRRLSQLSVLVLFLIGPWFGIWWLKGNLTSSLVLDTVPLTDPFVLLQTVLAGNLPEMAALIGGLLVAVFYGVVGGRMFCAWVCPVNMVTDLAGWLRRKLNIRKTTKLDRSLRYWIMAMVLIVPLFTGTIVWELVNPVSMFHRGLFFGMGAGWLVIAAVFLYDLFISRRGWCGHLCPMGAFYSVLGKGSLVKVNARHRSKCNDCMDCFAVCPEPQVIKPALKGADKGIGPVIIASDCTNCGRCIDVCGEQVFQFGSRFANEAERE